MKAINWKQIVPACVLLAIASPLHAGDIKQDQLKMKTEESPATLEVENGSTVISVGANAGRKYDVSHFRISTGTKDYVMQYRSFPANEAADNAGILNDSCSGYGMAKPDGNWYENGFITASVEGGGDISNHRGNIRVLKTEGPRVGYDLAFELEQGSIVVRTVAMAGRDELFVAVKSTNASEAKLTTSFRGYPMGFEGELNRWVHTAGNEIQHSGSAGKATSLDTSDDHWALLTDHNLATGGPGQLGLIWAPENIDKARVVHSGNYAILVNYEGRNTSPEQRFMVCHFDDMSWQDACKRIEELAKDAPSLIKQALDGWD